MENSKQGITMAEKRVEEMNKLTQGLLEQGNRFLQQRNQPQNEQRTFPQRNSPQRSNTQRSAPQYGDAPHQGMSGQNGQRQAFSQRSDNVQKPRFEAVGNSRKEPPPKSEPPSAERSNGFLPIALNSDSALLLMLTVLLMKENADIKLILALLYIMM